MQIFLTPSWVTWRPLFVLLTPAANKRAWLNLFGCCHGSLMRGCRCFLAVVCRGTVAWIRHPWIYTATRIHGFTHTHTHKATNLTSCASRLCSDFNLTNSEWPNINLQSNPVNKTNHSELRKGQMLITGLYHSLAVTTLGSSCLLIWCISDIVDDNLLKTLCPSNLIIWFQF